MTAAYIPFIKPAWDALRTILSWVLKGLSKRKQKQLLSTIVAELLKMEPDISTAKAKMIALDATGVEPSPELLRAKSMLEATENYSSKVKRLPGAATGMLKRKAAKKRAYSLAKRKAKHTIKQRSFRRITKR